MRSPETIVTAAHRRAFGATGIRVPPIVFDAGVLGNARRVLPEQTRFEICGEWLRRVEPPVFLHVAGQGGVVRAALSFLARALTRYEVATEDVVINLNLPLSSGEGEFNQSADALLKQWQNACEALGNTYRPRLAAIALPAVDIAVTEVSSALRVAGGVAGVGGIVRHWQEVSSIAVEATTSLDWLFCSSGPSLIDGRESNSNDAPLSLESILPIIAANVFAGDFLIGGNHPSGRTLNQFNQADEALLSWRKSFVALCHGHDITPAHASVQFALRQPAVAAVVAQTTHPDLVAESAQFAVTPVSESFWDALLEEGLVEGDFQ